MYSTPKNESNKENAKIINVLKAQNEGDSLLFFKDGIPICTIF